MPVSEKKFKNELKKMCNFVSTSSKKKDKDECINAFMCQFHKCNNELNEFRNARITDEELKKCKKNKNIKECLNELRKNRDFDNKKSNLEHCISNNCPIDIEYGLKNLDRHKINDNEKCEKCEKENNLYYNLIKEKLLKKNKCSKKYSIHKKQSKCAENKVLSNKIQKSMINNYKCISKLCQSPEKTSTKKSKEFNKSNKK